MCVRDGGGDPARFHGGFGVCCVVSKKKEIDKSEKLAMEPHGAVTICTYV